MREGRSFPDESIEVWRLDLTVTEGGYTVGSQLVGENEEYIWFGFVHFKIDFFGGSQTEYCPREELGNPLQ